MECCAEIGQNMLGPNEISEDIPKQQSESEHKACQIVPLSPGVATNMRDKKEWDARMLNSSKSITLTTLPILNKLPSSLAIDSKFQISTKLLTFNNNNCTSQHFSLPSLNSKNLIQCYPRNKYFCDNIFTKPLAFHCNLTRNVTSFNTRSWPLAGENYPGFKPLGYRTRPTFGGQCLRSGNQWASPCQELVPSLPVLDLFADEPTKSRFCEVVKNDKIAKPVKRVSRLRKNRFPTLFDSYNIHQRLFNIDAKSHSIIGRNLDQESLTDLPVVTSCTLNKVDNQKLYKNRGLREFFEDDCSECTLCTTEMKLHTRAGDVSVLKSNSPKYHIHLPTTD